MSRRRLLGIATTVLLCLAPAALQSQEEGGQREISGFVRIAGTNQPPPGTLVSLHSDAGEIITQTTPEGSGQFGFGGLRRGTYYVSARAPGYREASTRADLNLARHLTVQLFLTPDRRSEPQAPPQAGPVDQRQLRIPENARKEFERGTKELFENKSPAASLPHLRKATALYPEYYEAYHLMGTIYMDQQQWDQAEQMFNRALELNQQFAPAYFALGALRNQQGKPAEAEKFLLRGLELQPDAWQAHLEICQTYFSQGQLPQAEQHAVRAHELKPEVPVVHLVLANIYVAENSYAPARTEYQHFLDRAPQSPAAPRVQEQIRQLDRALARPASPNAAGKKKAKIDRRSFYGIP